MNFDDICAIFYHPAHRFPDLFGAIRNAILDARLTAKQVVTIAGEIIRMSTRSTDAPHRHQHPWTDNGAVRDRIAQCDIDEITGSQIAHGRKAGHECLSDPDRRIERQFWRILSHALHLALVVAAGISPAEVSMSIDEAGQECGVPKIDNRRIGWDCCSWTNRFDLVSSHQNNSRGRQPVALAVIESRRL